MIGLRSRASASMTAAAFHWPDTGTAGGSGLVFLLIRRWRFVASMMASGGAMSKWPSGASCGQCRGRTVPVAGWLAQVLGHVGGETIATILADRFKQGEVQDGAIGGGLSRAGDVARVRMARRGRGT